MSGEKGDESNFKKNKTLYDTEITGIKTALIPTNEDYKKILNENPDLDLTSQIENKLIYDAKLRYALKDPPGYFSDKMDKLKILGNKVNAEFAKVFNDVQKYAGKKKAKEMAIKSAKNLYEIEMHRIETEYPEKLDKDLESKLLFELKNKIN